jgi:hypothetical protein
MEKYSYEIVSAQFEVHPFVPGKRQPTASIARFNSAGKLLDIMQVSWTAYGNRHMPNLLKHFPSGEFVNFVEADKIATIIRSLMTKEN